MASRRVRHFHHTDFIGRQGDFGGWSNLKCDNFRKTMEKTIAKTVAFQVVVAVHRDTHADIKKRWRGVHGFKADSVMAYASGWRAFWSAMSSRGVSLPTHGSAFSWNPAPESLMLA
jgi:hypothetical protein